ncbi:hypothetical protein MAPG_01999 [Magnaporthiopsis poae ATCC 64411]|uniref:Uncharacterized protein n=1 Tax=Magnaporthiopsis poae (strain ATCC 64411 / 73-15) TaxID=644358 RepID=A0A0C4DQ61_MAGP6|nr:hypothetical protein MAPG_01999 [Magnaporthiopsis poae ATCC 64411]
MLRVGRYATAESISPLLAQGGTRPSLGRSLPGRKLWHGMPGAHTTARRSGKKLFWPELRRVKRRPLGLLVANLLATATLYMPTLTQPGLLLSAIPRTYQPNHARPKLNPAAFRGRDRGTVRV